MHKLITKYTHMAMCSNFFCSFTNDEKSLGASALAYLANSGFPQQLPHHHPHTHPSNHQTLSTS